MTVYGAAIEAAKRLIDAKGEAATVRRVVPGSPNVDQPWKAAPPMAVDFPVSAVWLNFGTQSAGQEYWQGSLVKANDRKVLIAAVDLAGLSTSDFIVRADGSVWKITSVQILDPNGEKILWTVKAEQ
ncbi:MAG: hypothetical protein DDT26_00028 [Dehalococcoidia bacterium]|nr:hypothetical protein [Chloroflexota bacterium]